MIESKEAREPSRNVTFRLPADELRDLQGLAAQQKKSPGDFARDATRRDLAGWDQAEQFRALELEVRELAVALRAHRRDLRTIAIALLMVAGKLSRADAVRWADENLGRTDGAGRADRQG